jgi:hypothetical protein
MSQKNLKLLYKSFLIKSLINDVDKWEMYDSSIYNSGDKFNYNVDYLDLSITIDTDSFFDVVKVFNKNNSEAFYFLSKFHFLFNNELRYAYRYMKKYHKNKANKEFEDSFMKILPLSEIRKQKLQKLLDI